MNIMSTIKDMDLPYKFQSQAVENAYTLLSLVKGVLPAEVIADIQAAIEKFEFQSGVSYLTIMSPPVESAVATWSMITSQFGINMLMYTRIKSVPLASDARKVYVKTVLELDTKGTYRQVDTMEWCK